MKIILVVTLFLTCCSSFESETSGKTNKDFPDADGVTSIHVTTATVLHDIDSATLGININYLTDKNLGLDSRHDINSALSGLNTRILRFPGGEKSDNYLWAQHPFTNANHSLAIKSETAWPNSDNRFCSDPVTGRLTEETLNFDDIIQVASGINAKLMVVVAYDSIFFKGVGKPLKEDLIESAVEWVKYANIDNNFRVNLWMIGNETWNSNSYNGSATALQYSTDLADYSASMRAIDPTIKIIANSKGYDYTRVLLENAKEHIDYIGISNYPIHEWSGGYSEYKNYSGSLLGETDEVLRAIQSYGTTQKIIITEFCAIDWSGEWTSKNDTGHALCSFEIAGEQLNNPNIEYSFFWTTQWVNNDGYPYHAFDKSGNKTAAGKSLWLWSRFPLTQMVSIESTTLIRCFASFDSLSKKLYLYMINKDNEYNRKISIVLNDFSTKSIGMSYTMKGQSSDDSNPSLTEFLGTAISDSGLNITLPALSITVIELNGE
ncbi:MAG: hypothetical protein JXK07_04825 [Spirochaetes bacterium]|nr:hypothetical protein [Spirochaetota bacterium]MBN2771959.1 hypothetical protein [Spirochaetota bacterium]